MTFHLLACEFVLSARRLIQFPHGMAGNVLRGALGTFLRDVAGEDHARIFQPGATGPGPSGLSDWPRPFVIRCASLNGRTVQPGEQFCFGIHWFATRDAGLDYLAQAFSHWSDLISVRQSEILLDLNPRREPASRMRVQFLTPTDLKSATPEDFAALLSRARDRVSTLRSLYGSGPLEIDFRGLGERARSVRTAGSELRRVAIERRSSRTGQRHDIGGVVGFAEYEGQLAEFVPLLEAVCWTGVGRHCAWGNGQMTIKVVA